MGGKRTRLVITIIIILTLTGCVTFRKVNITPRGSNVFWYNGKPRLRLKEDDFYLDISYRGTARDIISFDVKIANTGKDTLMVSPEDFFIRFMAFEAEPPKTSTEEFYGEWDSQDKETMDYQATEPKDTVKTIEKEIVLYAIGADEKMQILEKKAIGRTQQSQVVVGGAAVCCLVGSLVTIFSGDEREGETKEERRARKANTVGKIADISADVATDEMERYNRDMEKIDREFNFWAKSVMRKTTLFRGDSISSLVVFSYKPELQKSNTLEICFPVNGKLLKAEFDMQVITYE